MTRTIPKWTIDLANPNKWIRAEFELTRTPDGLSDRRVMK